MRLDASSLQFDLEKTLDDILRFIRNAVKGANASGVVVGLSGGVDSTLTTALCCRALGRDRVLGVLMPLSFTPREDIEDALQLAKILGIRTERVDIDEVCKAFVATLGVREGDLRMRLPIANIRARVRMVILYFFANARNYLVAGTGDRSELLLGFFTKHGDGGADFFPIVHVYKTQARELAKYIGVPEKMAIKPSSPQLYPGHKLSDEVPLDYIRLDPVLLGLFDHKLPPEKVSELTNVPLEIIMEVMNRHRKTEHKRKPPPTVREKQ